MPFLNLKRLMPPLKIWKLFTKQLIKLHKPNKSKAIIIKKPNFSSNKTPKKLSWPSLSIQPKKFKKHKFKFKPNSILNHHKQPLPVYVDQLFIEPVSATKEQRKKLPLAEVEARKNDESCSSNGFKKREPETSSHADEADEMWENLELESQHEQQGINERAEEFIARFRAQMHNQEILARRHL